MVPRAGPPQTCYFNKLAASATNLLPAVYWGFPADCRTTYFNSEKYSRPQLFFAASGLQLLSTQTADTEQTEPQ